MNKLLRVGLKLNLVRFMISFWWLGYYLITKDMLIPYHESESFGKLSLSLSLSLSRERERERETCVLPKGFEPRSFPLKFSPLTFEYMIHSVEVDLYYFKYL